MRLKPRRTEPMRQKDAVDISTVDQVQGGSWEGLLSHTDSRPCPVGNLDRPSAETIDLRPVDLARVSSAFACPDDQLTAIVPAA